MSIAKITCILESLQSPVHYDAVFFFLFRLFVVFF